MIAYAVAVIRKMRFGPDIKEYLLRIDETLSPFSGKYRVHGGPYVPVEGSWSGELVVIEFPTLEMAKSWYGSAAYNAIRSLRMNNTEGDVFFVHGVSDGHRGADILS